MATKVVKYITGNRRDGGGRKAAATYDYIARLQEKQKTEEVLASGAAHMPAWVGNQERSFWQAADDYERKNGSCCEHMVIALPNELDLEQNIQAIKSFTEDHLLNHPLSWRIHAGSKDDPNPHVHIIFSKRSKALTKEENQKVWTGTKATAKKQFFKRNGAKKCEWIMAKGGWTASHKIWVKHCNAALKLANKKTSLNADPKWVQRKQAETAKKNVVTKMGAALKVIPNPNVGEDKHIPQWRITQARKDARKGQGDFQELLAQHERQWELIKIGDPYEEGRTRKKAREDRKRTEDLEQRAASAEAERVTRELQEQRIRTEQLARQSEEMAGDALKARERASKRLRGTATASGRLGELEDCLSGEFSRPERNENHNQQAGVNRRQAERTRGREWWGSIRRRLRRSFRRIIEAFKGSRRVGRDSGVLENNKKITLPRFQPRKKKGGQSIGGSWS